LAHPLPIHPATKLGVVQLKVRDLERSLTFYQEVIGLRLLRQNGHVAELTIDGQHPLLILEADPRYRVLPEQSVSGLYHFAILVPGQVTLGLVLRNLIRHQIPVGQGDHLVSEALYLSDPDQNGIEIYADRPRATWQKTASGEIHMTTDPVDIQNLLQLSEHAQWNGLPEGTRMGHVHFHVGDLQVAEQFYCGVLGFEVTLHFGASALFISAGGYHHHIGLNLWAGKGAPPAPEDAVGIRYFTVELPDVPALDAVVSRLDEARVVYTREGNELRLSDPFGIGIKLTVAA